MDNTRAIGLMILAMVFFTIGDSVIKLASQSAPLGLLMVLLGVFGALTLAALTRLKGHRVLTRDFLNPVMIWRNLSEIVGTLCMFIALSKVELSTVAAILQATPLAVTLGAAVILREHVGWRRWAATLVGFVGVLIIMRPGGVNFDMQTLWPLAAMLGLSMRDLSTRIIPKTVPTLRIATYGMSMLIPAGLILIALEQRPQNLDPYLALMIAISVTVGVIGYLSITAAMRMGEVSLVAPFRYARILFALVIGALVFGERPDMWTLIGAAITVLAGLYIFLREARAKAAA